MNWNAVGAIGDILSAAGVVLTLIYLSIQVRHGKAAVEENTRTANIGVLEQHTQAQSRWRGRLAEEGELAEIWVAAKRGRDALNEIDRERFNQHGRDFFNIWRSSFAAAQSIKHEGQMEHIAVSFATMASGHQGLLELWDAGGKKYSELTVPEFVETVEKAMGRT